MAERFRGVLLIGFKRAKARKEIIECIRDNLKGVNKNDCNGY
ncbi:hypothetical protein [Bacillus phage Nachito]|nr:hypothetical protein [Bacillus phage Nachito]